MLNRARKILLVASRLAMGGVFVFSGIEKLFSLREFATIVVNYQILPERIAVYFGYLLPWLELALGILLIAGIHIRKAALGLSILIVVFMAALTIRSATGPLHECGCFLSAGAGVRHGLGFYLIRDALLLCLGMVLLLSPRPKVRAREIPPPDSRLRVALRRPL